MAKKKFEMIAGALLLLQLPAMLFFFGPRMARAGTTVKGANLAEQICIEAFTLLLLGMAVAGYRRARSRHAMYPIVGSAFGVLITLAMIVTLVANSYKWGANDWQTIAAAAAGSFLVVAYARAKSISMKHPIVLGCLAIACKAVPHVMLGVKILQEGNGALPPISLAMGHALILFRLAHIYLLVKTEGEWGIERKGAFLADATGEVSWIFVTISWFLRQ